MELPKGLSFKPTDAELISYYLQKKILGEPFTSLNYINDEEIYGEKAPSHPSQLFEGSSSDGLYFFTKLKKKFINGNIIDRIAGNGCWTIKSRTKVYDNDNKSLVIGEKIYLTFTVKSLQQALEMGKNQQSQRQWQMYEYTWKNARFKKDEDGKDSVWVVCMIKKGKLFDTSDNPPSPQSSSHTWTDHESNMPYKKHTYCKSSSLALKTTTHNEGLVQQKGKGKLLNTSDDPPSSSSLSSSSLSSSSSSRIRTDDESNRPYKKQTCCRLSFKPTDAEIILYYLQKKILGEPFTSLNYIKDGEIYGEKAPSHPSQLFEGRSSNELYFFTKLKNKFTRSHNIDRTAGNGSWTIRLRKKVYDNDNKSLVIGYKNYLTFTVKSPQQPLKMDKNQQPRHQWQMYEYTWTNAPVEKDADGKDSIWAVCMIKKGKLLDTSDNPPSPLLSSRTWTDHESNMPYKKYTYCRSWSLKSKAATYTEGQGLVQQKGKRKLVNSSDDPPSPPLLSHTWTDHESKMPYKKRICHRSSSLALKTPTHNEGLVQQKGKGKLLNTADDPPSLPSSSRTWTDDESNMPCKKHTYCRSLSLALKTNAFNEELVQQDHKVPPLFQMDQQQCIIDNKANDWIYPVETASLSSLPLKSVPTSNEEVLQQEFLIAQHLSQQQFSSDINLDDWLSNCIGDDIVDDSLVLTLDDLPSCFEHIQQAKCADNNETSSSQNQGGTTSTSCSARGAPTTI